MLPYASTTAELAAPNGLAQRNIVVPVVLLRLLAHAAEILDNPPHRALVRVQDTPEAASALMMDVHVIVIGLADVQLEGWK
jgi:hypothetical protein